jgi:hypothetical protein
MDNAVTVVALTALVTSLASKGAEGLNCWCVLNSKYFVYLFIKDEMTDV